MVDIYFTADTHFGHKNIIKHCNRPFKSINEMDEILIENWNKKVKGNSLVYHLGDFAWVLSFNYLKRLNGRIFLILGNHDNSSLKIEWGWRKGEFKHFVGIRALREVKILKNKIVLCHYAMRTWNKSHHNSWHLFGHSHGTLSPIGKSWDVGVDNNNFTPLHYDEIAEIMEKRPDNPNLIKGRK